MTGASHTPPILEIAGLTLRPSGQPLITDLALTVARGSIHAIVGPNGAGKTTLLSAILGLLPFAGRIVAHWEGRGRIGYVPQRFHVDRTLPVTVGDFLALTRQRRPVCAGVSRSTRSHIGRLLDRVGVRGLAARPLSVLSGGELKRVLIAHALDPIPELLVLDEPASGLDAEGARWLEETLVSLKGETTVLMVSHDADQVKRIADTVTRLRATNGDRFGEAGSHEPC